MEELNFFLIEDQPVLNFLMKSLPLQQLTQAEPRNFIQSFILMFLIQITNRSKHIFSQSSQLLKYLAPHYKILTIRHLYQDLSMIAKIQTLKKTVHLQPFLHQYALPLPKILLQKLVFWKNNFKLIKFFFKMIFILKRMSQ